MANKTFMRQVKSALRTERDLGRCDGHELLFDVPGDVVIARYDAKTDAVCFEARMDKGMTSTICQLESKASEQLRSGYAFADNGALILGGGYSLEGEEVERLLVWLDERDPPFAPLEFSTRERLSGLSA